MAATARTVCAVAPTIPIVADAGIFQNLVHLFGLLVKITVVLDTIFFFSITKSVIMIKK